MSKLMTIPEIQARIIELRGKKIILDRDLAKLYQVKPFRLREQIKRNLGRFPSDFMFQLREDEVGFMVSQNAIPNRKYLGGTRPYVFTRNGANMVSTILKSKIAVKRSIQIMRAFSALEEVVAKTRETLTESPEIIEQLSLHSKALKQLFQTTRLNSKQMAKVRKMQKEMVGLLQTIICASLREKS